MTGMVELALTKDPVGWIVAAIVGGFFALHVIRTFSGYYDRKSK